MQHETQKIIRKLKAYIETQQKMGIEGFYAPESFFLKAEEKPGYKNLEELKKSVLKCRRCQLYKTKHNYVFGDGDQRARLMFIGEAPGADEDMQGLPFVGLAGKLLTKIIEAMGLKRSQVYIGNILKCRPPENRNPLPEEIEACREYIDAQVEMIKPKIICALGKFAAQALLETDEPISSLRGRSFEYKGTTLIPTYHPAYLLRNPNDKKLVWEDMKKIRDILNK